MTKEELEKEAREYLAEHSKYSEVFGEFFVAVDTLTAMVDFAEPREKQIQIDAEQIRALQKQNGELTDELTKKADTNHQLVEQMAELSERNDKLQQAMKHIHNLLYVYQLGKNELATARIRAEAEQFLRDNGYFN